MRTTKARLSVAGALAVLLPLAAGAGGPDHVKGAGLNEGWFEFGVHALSFDGARPHGALFVDELGADNYDVNGRIVCMATQDQGAVIAATRPESATETRVVFIAVQDLSDTDLDRAAPAFTVVPNGTPLIGACENAIFLLGATEPLDDGEVRVRDR